MKDIDLAVELLEKENFTLAAVKESKVIFSSYEEGIKPLYTVVKEEKEVLKGSSIADRVTGKAAAMLCAYAEIKELKTGLISHSCVWQYENTIFGHLKYKFPYVIASTIFT